MKIITALSGGVDSAVALKILLAEGHQVEAMFMKNWEEDDGGESCSAEEDLRDAENIAGLLGVKLHKVNFSHEYWEHVFMNFLNEIKRGRTPNPDVLCNREIKFKAFLEHAQALGAEKIATGHYALLTNDKKIYRLYRGKDNSKDQSYFLYQLNQNQLKSAIFPLGSMSKKEVRNIAVRNGFGNAAKKDSVGICFIGERKFDEFLARYVTSKPGDMVSKDGKKVGRHRGLAFYTIGQRKGLGIGGVRGFADAPWYVLKKNIADNTLIVGQNHDDSWLLSHEVTVENPHWIADVPAELPFACCAQTRYRQQASPCVITKLNDKSMNVVFEREQNAVTPGQSLVIYRDDECLGGGVIRDTR